VLCALAYALRLRQAHSDSRGAKASCAIVMVHPVRCSNSVVYTKPVGVEIVVQLLFVVVD
jgi:hypothetical protein